MQSRFQDFRRDDAGVTTIEYGLIGMLVCLVIVFAVTEMGLSVYEVMSQVVAGFGAN